MYQVVRSVVIIGLIISGMTADMSAYGHTSKQNPAAFNTATNIGDYAIIETDVGSTNRTEDGTHYTLDGHRLIIKGSITCTLPSSETCIMKELDLGVNLIPDGFLNIPSSKHNRS